MRASPPLSLKNLRLVAVGALVAVLACTEPTPTSLGDVGVSFAKGGGGPQVNAAEPNSAPPDITLDVRVIGTGFVEGSAVEFLLAGQSTPKVVTNASTWIDEENIIANITISADADLALYDIAVRPPRGKGGIGTELFSVQQPGGGGHPSVTSLTADFEPGGTFSSGGAPYVDGDGSTVQLSGSGVLSLLVPLPHGVDIAEIRESDGTLIVSAPGLVGASFFTKACCDLWDMTADSAGVSLTGDTIPIKLRVRWDVSDGWWVISMGATSNCIDGSAPADDPGRGTWARAIRTSETTWTIESAGPAAVCRIIDKKGKKNDKAILWTDAIIDMKLLFSTLP